MKTADTLAMGFRSLKERPLETGLIILGITLASCVAAASLLLLLSQKAQSERILAGPAYREILVSSTADPAASNARSGVTLIDQRDTTNFSLDNSDLTTVTSQTPLVAYAYRANSTRFRLNFGQGRNAVVNVVGGNATAAAVAPATTTTVAATAETADTGTKPKGKRSTTTTVAGAADPFAGNPQPQATTGELSNATVTLQSGPGTAQGSVAVGKADAAGANVVVQGGPGGPGGFPGFQEEAAPEGTTLLTPAVEEFNGANVNPSFFAAYGVSTAQGSLFTDEDATNNASTLVLGPNLAKTLFPDKAAADLVGQKLRLEGRIWTIVGILDKNAAGLSLANGNSLADLAFAPIRQRGFGGDGGGPGGFGGQSNNLRFAVAKVADLKAATEALTKYFDAKYGESKVSIVVPFDAAQLSQSGFERLLWIIVAFGVGTLVMALINLMNMMLTRALRRQAAMGIMAAMGANRSTLTGLQAVEGGLMALTGTAIGVALAIPLYELLYQAGKSLFNLTTTASFDWGALLLVTPALLVLTLVLALIPAWQSSKISITTALRSE